MYYFFFYDQDVCIGEGYGLDPDDAIRRYCVKMGFGPDAADYMHVVCVLSKSDFTTCPWNCASVVG